MKQPLANVMVMVITIAVSMLMPSIASSQTTENSKLDTAKLSVDIIDNRTLVNLGSAFCEIFVTQAESQWVSDIVSRAEEILGVSVSHEAEDIEFRGRVLGVQVNLQTAQTQPFNVRLITPPAQPGRTIVTSFLKTDSEAAHMQLYLNSDCNVQQATQLHYNENSIARYSQQLNVETMQPMGEKDWINPPLPTLAPITPARLRVAMVDAGVNYRLPEIAQALARDGQGKLIGFDFWEMDDQPYDSHSTNSPFVVQRHGTRTASIVIREAPGIAIVPYRYPRTDMSRMQTLIEHAAENQVRIVGMPLGGNRFDQWAAFQKAAEAHPQILFIASAGNNGRDIDQRGVFPAALEIDNMLVVTSADDFAKPAERTNYGRIAVDYLLPAEGITTTDYDGTERRVSGSSYAVSRLVALAARLLNRTPSMTTTDLKAAIQQHSVRANTSRYVSTGYIGDPLASPEPLAITQREFNAQAVTPTDHVLDVDIFVISEKWQTDKIAAALMEANEILQQCDIQLKVGHWYEAQIPEYLQNLSTGNAMTLHRKLPVQRLSIFFAGDTDMQIPFDAEAFGEGNTRNRPWMRNTLWLTSAIDDSGIAVAHELFHIIINDGSHSQVDGNLMMERTTPENIRLLPAQCDAALNYARSEGLLNELDR